MSSTFYILIFALCCGDGDNGVILKFLRSDFEIVRSTKDFPVAVGTDQIMADPGMLFNKTDVAIDEDSNLPFQRLIFAGQSDSLCFVYFENGGVGYSQMLVIFTTYGENVQTIWAGWTLFETAKDVNSLKHALSNCEFITVKDLQQQKRQVTDGVVVLYALDKYNKVYMLKK